MSYTNQTPHYHLPQYIGTDKPSYLSDFNDAMSIIDTNIYNANANAETALNQSSAASTEVTALTPKVNDNTSDIELLKANVTTLTNLLNTQITNGVIYAELTPRGQTLLEFRNQQGISYRQFILNNLKITSLYGQINAYIKSNSTNLGNLSEIRLNLNNILGVSRQFNNVGNVLFTKSNDTLESNTAYNLGYNSIDNIYYPSAVQAGASTLNLKNDTRIALSFQICILG